MAILMQNHRLLSLRQSSKIAKCWKQKSWFIYIETHTPLGYSYKKPLPLSVSYVQNRDSARVRGEYRREKKIPYGIVGDNEFSPCVLLGDLTKKKYGKNKIQNQNKDSVQWAGGSRGF